MEKSGGLRNGNGPLDLSARQVEILAAVARGMSTREAADAFHISAATAKRHLADAYYKMGVSSRTEALSAAMRSGLLSAEELWGPAAWGDAARYRCVEGGCGREIVVVRPSADPDWRETPRCHNRAMARVASQAAAYRK